MHEAEAKKEKQRQERQEVFEDQFNQDIKEYKKSGQVVSKFFYIFILFCVLI